MGDARPTQSSARPSRCPYARLGLAFYRSRFIHWQLQRGASSPSWRKPRNCADARYLVLVWSKRSWQSRQRYERFVRQKAERERRALVQVVKRLEPVLAGTPMAGTEEILVRIGRKHNVSPYFIVGAAAKESSIGEAACSNNRFNVWGLAACNGIWYVPPFRSWEEAIDFYARFLNRQWPGHSSPFSFRGYAACSECWASWISSYMSQRFGTSRTTYP